MKTFWIVLITLIVTAGIIGGGGWWYMQAKAEKEKKSLQTQIDDLTKQVNGLKAGESSATSTSSSTASSAKDSQTNLDSAEAVVKNFLDAKKTRSLENAKSYMTTAFYNSTNQEEFAGTSSPSMGRYTITKAEYLSTADLYKVTARVYQNLQNEEVGYAENTYMVENQSGKFLVNEVKEGEWTDTE